MTLNANGELTESGIPETWAVCVTSPPTWERRPPNS
jgi:hypothetical protein